MVSEEDRYSFQCVVQKLQKSILSHARRPWLRASSNCYDAVGEMDEHFKESFSVSDKAIRRVAFLDLGVRLRVVVSGGEDGKLCLHDLDDVCRSAVELGVHETGVTGVAVSDGCGSDGSPLVALSSGDGAVCIWDPSPLLRNSGEAKSRGARITVVGEDLRVSTLLEGGSTREALDVSISADGSRVLAADCKYGKDQLGQLEVDWRVHLWMRRPRSLNENSAAGGLALSCENRRSKRRFVFEYSTQTSIFSCHVAVSKDGETALHCEVTSKLRSARCREEFLGHGAHRMEFSCTRPMPSTPVSFILKRRMTRVKVPGPIGMKTMTKFNQYCCQMLHCIWLAATLYAGTENGRILSFEASARTSCATHTRQPRRLSGVSSQSLPQAEALSS